MEMKKYMTPEMEVVEMESQVALLADSDPNTAGGSGSLEPGDDPNE